MTKQKQNNEHYFAANPKSIAKFGVIQTSLRGKSFEFLTSSSVFSKKRVDTGTRILIEAMILPKTGSLLDVGCGYGAVGIAAATFNPALRVIMSDINIRAIRLTRDNIQRNKLSNAEVRHGYLYEPVEDLTFNCVLSNPPVSAGMEIVKAAIAEAPKIMAEKATLQMVVRSKIGGKILPAIFTDTFDNCKVLARESGYRVLLGQKQSL